MLVRSTTFWAQNVGRGDVCCARFRSTCSDNEAVYYSTKYKAAQQAGTLNGMKWNDFRKAV